MLAVSSVNVRFQEACMRAYIDDDTEPTYLSSGTEDYFASSFDFGEFGSSNYYHSPLAGLTHHCWRGDSDGDGANATGKCKQIPPPYPTGHKDVLASLHFFYNKISVYHNLVLLLLCLHRPKLKLHPECVPVSRG